MKVYSTQDIRDDLVLRGFEEKINYSQVRLDLGKQIGYIDMNIDTILKEACHLKAVTRLEAGQTQKVAVNRWDDTRSVVEAVTKLVNELSVNDKQCENRRTHSREPSSSRGRWGEDRRYIGQKQDCGFSDSRRLQRQNQATLLDT